MKLVITVKMVPESAQELSEEVPAQVIEVQNHYNELAKEGILGPPDRVTLRYMLIGNELTQVHIPQSPDQGEVV